jgi:predicted house-cleaning noncanonical NTP pyrophosphatase (MazG superfamily)
MPQSVKERVAKLREEIAEIGASDQERRLQRLQEIMDELMSLTDWKKT